MSTQVCAKELDNLLLKSLSHKKKVWELQNCFSKMVRVTCMTLGSRVSSLMIRSNMASIKIKVAHVVFLQPFKPSS